MSSSNNTEKRLTVLIDADNAQASIIEGLLAEVSKHGVASVKRIYGDWTKPLLKNWKEVLLTHAIQPIQQFSYTKGKNATDMAMVIDAMDLLYSNRFDGFCIVSSDSDFTRLASRVREAGLLVYGFGEKKTPQAFVSACDKFIYTEILTTASEPSKKMTPKNTTELKRDTRLANLFRGAVESAADDSGWANLATVGNKIVNQAPEFDSRNYGYAKLGELIDATQLFDIDVRTIGKEGHKVTYIKDKRK
ncbi:MAG: NYN domain-containing protein [Thermodesulfovibrionia bacterium]|nr:NYN domain-containing protein [Thermodesulfovibrionia bacterium]